MENSALSMREKLLTAVSLAVFAAAAAIAFYAPVCMYYEGRMRVNDYGIYVNFIWNSANGQLFRYLMDFSYLQVHLSFTLLLLAPLFHVWDHPYLLALVQSATLPAGGLLVLLILRRSGAGLPVAAAAMSLFAGYALMQQVVLCDFHGVCLYLVLVPWLYYTACFRRGWVWLPVALTLGLREDAGLVIVPMLCWLAARDRWRAGWLWAALAAVYTASACTWLFEWINGFGLAGVPRRGHYFETANVLLSLDADGFRRRVVAVLWLYFPAMLFLRRGTWIPVVTFPLLALIPLMFSPDARVHGLRVQYPAIVFTGVALAIVDGLRREVPIARKRAAEHVVFFLAVILLSAWRFGVGYQELANDIPWTPSARGRYTEQVAFKIPRDGTLLTSTALCGFTANRRDLMVIGRNEIDPSRVDHVFLRADNFDEPPELESFLRSDEFGVAYFDFSYVILSRGADPSDKALVRACSRYAQRAVPFFRTPSAGGTEVYDPGCGWARYWGGAGGASSNRVAFGRHVSLPRGRHAVLVRLRTDPAQSSVTNRGSIALRRRGADEVLAGEDFAIGPPEGGFFLQKFELDLAEDMNVEPRVTGGEARLWLDKVVFLPLQP